MGEVVSRSSRGMHRKCSLRILCRLTNNQPPASAFGWGGALANCATTDIQPMSVYSLTAIRCSEPPTAVLKIYCERLIIQNPFLIRELHTPLVVVGDRHSGIIMIASNIYN